MLNRHPKSGVILKCNYDTGFKPPEMVKTRAVVVVSEPHRERPGLCTVVPLSATDPNRPLWWHVKISNPFNDDRLLQGTQSWAKCDMIFAASFKRLSFFRRLDVMGQQMYDPEGKRIYQTKPISKEDLKAIRNGVMASIGIRET